MSTCPLQIRASDYRRRGFLVIENLLSPERTELLRARTQAIAEGHLLRFRRSDIEVEPGADTMTLRTVRKLNRCAESDSVFMTHARSKQILDIVESLIGPDIKLFGSQCFMKPPGGVEKPYHQDSAYFTIEPMDLVTCWTALDDVTLDNGPVWIIPSSHELGLLDHSLDWFIGDRRDKQIPDELFDRKDEMPITMSAGSCSFHHSLLLHRSSPNRSDKPRRGLAIHYMSAKSRWTHPTEPQPKYILLKGREYPNCV